MSRQIYLIAAAALFAALIVVALFVHDAIVRPYGGDFLVVIFLYVLARGVLTLDRWQSAALVFAVACAVELAQALNLVRLLGLAQNSVAGVVIGAHADVADISMYAAGALCAALLDRRRAS